MRIVSFVASSSKQAMIDLRASLGDDAVILSTQTHQDGKVSVTGAVADDAFDLTDVLVPAEEPRNLDWLNALAAFHEWSIKRRERIEPILENLSPAEPEAILATLVRAFFRFEDSRWPGRKPLLLSGPPGSGKTVTIAKIAATQVLAGHTVDIITLDVGRAGSLDQITTLLEPLGLLPKPVSSSSDLQSAIATCRGDVILLDSVSTNPFNPADLGKLSSLVARAGAELLPVLPAGQGGADTAEMARSYAALGAKAMVVTKLDVARRLGSVLAAAEAGLAFTQAGIGPTIGDGLCTLSADGLARLLLRRYRTSINEETSR